MSRVAAGVYSHILNIKSTVYVLEDVRDSHLPYWGHTRGAVVPVIKPKDGRPPCRLAANNVINLLLGLFQHEEVLMWRLSFSCQ